MTSRTVLVWVFRSSSESSEREAVILDVASPRDRDLEGQFLAVECEDDRGFGLYVVDASEGDFESGDVFHATRPPLADIWSVMGHELPAMTTATVGFA